MTSGSQIALYSLAAVLAAGGCYAVYFDHKRRTDPEFRHRISKIVVMYGVVLILLKSEVSAKHRKMCWLLLGGAKQISGKRSP